MMSSRRQLLNGRRLPEDHAAKGKLHSGSLSVWVSPTYAYNETPPTERVLVQLSRTELARLRRWRACTTTGLQTERHHPTDPRHALRLTGKGEARNKRLLSLTNTGRQAAPPTLCGIPLATPEKGSTARLRTTCVRLPKERPATPTLRHCPLLGYPSQVAASPAYITLRKRPVLVGNGCSA